MIFPVVAYGDPILKLKAHEITSNEFNDLGSLIDDLWETMYNANGVGIAAPQIGISKTIFVIDFSFFTTCQVNQTYNADQAYRPPPLYASSRDLQVKQQVWRI
jgi:peptide deformylase